MGIRIQPREIEIPKDNPFKNDLLGRKEQVEVLTHLVSSLEGPSVLAVDALWGNGKTTFLNMWAQYLRNQGFRIVKFNAWETDFSGDPFVALATELTEGLREYSGKRMEKKVEATKECAKEVLRRAVPGVIRLTTAGILDVNPLLEKEVGNTLASYAEEKLSAYQETQESVKKFRATLADMAGAVSKPKSDRPLIVMIDELDRCRPSYAVELLEVAKHLFAVDHIVFVLAVNRSELAHSIRALYGDGFDAHGYLRRFFDVDFRLPEPDRAAFINELLASIRLDDYFKRTQDSTARGDYEVLRKWLLCFFHAPDLSLRRIAQAIHRLGLVLASLRGDRQSFALTAVVCLILRTIDSDLYHRFARGEASDLDVVDKVFNRFWSGTLKEVDERYFFEAIIIVAAQEEANSRLESSERISSPLLEHYEAIIQRVLSDQMTGASDYIHAEAVKKRFHELRRSLSNASIGFKYSVRRLELLSPDLVGEPATKQQNP